MKPDGAVYPLPLEGETDTADGAVFTQAWKAVGTVAPAALASKLRWPGCRASFQSRNALSEFPIPQAKTITPRG